MKVRTQLASVVLAGAVLAAGGTSSALASSSVRAPSCDHPLVVHDIRGTALKWQYVTRREAAYFGISRCSYVISGQRGSAVMTPGGAVVATS
jgi:hypothetical protein